MMKKSVFAEKLGFQSYEDVLDASREIYAEGDISWFLTELPDGRWAAWDDAEIDIDRVETFYHRFEAEDYQILCMAQKIEDPARRFLFVLRGMEEQLARPHREGHCEHAGRCEVIPVLADFLDSPAGPKSLDGFGDWYENQTPSQLFTEIVSRDFRSVDWIEESELPAWREVVKAAGIEYAVV